MLNIVIDASTLVSAALMPRSVPRRDSKDDKYLALAVSAGADLIVSSDNDLLVLHPFRGIPIVTPRVFLDRDGVSS